MDMVLLDWTRMGKTYCLAGAVPEGHGWKFVRPLLNKYRHGPFRNVGWPPYLMAEHQRWEIFELIRPQWAEPQPPHLEDMWVLGMRSRRKQAPVELRRTILEAGIRPEGEPLFGVRLTGNRTAAFLQPGTGERSLVTFMVNADQILFNAVARQGAEEVDYRVSLNVPGLQERWLAVKDHFLLQRAEQAGPEIQAGVSALTRAVQQMGNKVAVRLGLSRSFDPKEKEDHSTGLCWLMADGFFSFEEPQP